MAGVVRLRGRAARPPALSQLLAGRRRRARSPRTGADSVAAADAARPDVHDAIAASVPRRGPPGSARPATCVQLGDELHLGDDDQRGRRRPARTAASSNPATDISLRGDERRPRPRRCRADTRAAARTTDAGERVARPARRGAPTGVGAVAHRACAARRSTTVSASHRPASDGLGARPAAPTPPAPPSGHATSPASSASSSSSSSFAHRLPILPRRRGVARRAHLA